MRIMYLLYSFTVGGTERLVTDICNQMVHRGNTVHLFVVNDLVSESLLEELHEAVVLKRYGRKPGSADKLGPLVSIARYIMKHKIQVVHCNSFSSPELLMLAKFCCPKLRVIYTVHGLEQYKTLNKLKTAYRNVLCDRIVAISESVKEDVISAGASRKKVVVVENAVDFSRYAPDSFEQSIEGEIVVGNVARIEPSVKGQDVLVRAIAMLKDKYPNIRCDFAGAAAQKDMAQYDALIEFEMEELRVMLNALFKKIGFEGIFSVEFLVDEDDNLRFLEINFRNSTWSYAATHVGMPLPVLWSLGMMDPSAVSGCCRDFDAFDAIVELSDYRARVKSNMVSMRQWLTDLLKSPCKYYWGNGKDIGPLIGYFSGTIRNKLHFGG